MDNFSSIGSELLIGLLAVVAAVLGLTMLLAKNTLTSALALLGILLITAGIYGLIGAHFVATIQLVVYAGAIMVLFIFSIMLLNLSQDEREINWEKKRILISCVVGLVLFSVLGISLVQGILNPGPNNELPNLALRSPFTVEAIARMGGNVNVLSHALFTQYYIPFEAISLALIVAIIGAIVLAKRKVD